MLGTTAAALATLACGLVSRAPRAPRDAVGRLARDVAFLAGPALDGRGAGTPGADSAAAFLAARHAALGLAGAFRRPDCAPAAPCRAAHLQRFAAGGVSVVNVGAVVPGRDPARRDEYVIVGAHYDHLGRSSRGSRDGAAGRGVVHPGADDNASGTAAVLELARRLAARPARRSVLLLHFGAEEIGLLGSRGYVSRPAVPLAATVAMLDLDMVGRLRRGRLWVDGVGSAYGLGALLDGANADAARAAGAAPLDLRVVVETIPHSDDAPFAECGVPAVHLHTGMHGDYHRASDVAARVNGAGLARVTDLVEAAVRRLADADARPVPRAGAAACAPAARASP